MHWAICGKTAADINFVQADTFDNLKENFG